jgi:hypothetical protein
MYGSTIRHAASPSTSRTWLPLISPPPRRNQRWYVPLAITYRNCVSTYEINAGTAFVISRNWSSRSRSACSARLRSVTSTIVAIVRSGRPSASRSSRPVTCTHATVPSLRR